MTDVTDSDRLRRFVFERFNIRGELVHLDATWRAVLELHHYPAPIRQVLGEAMAAAALMASTLKFDGALTLQLQGEGPMHLLVVQCTSRNTLRGLARWEGEPAGGTLDALTGRGRLMITVESGARQQRFQGIVPLEGATLAECMQQYFDTSLQLPTRMWLATGAQRVAGLLIQKLPDAVDTLSNLGPDDADDWRRIGLLAGTLSEAELLGLTDLEILRRLFHQDDVRLFEPRPVSFRCTCSRRRIESVLLSLGREEIDDIIAERDNIETTCEFCNRNYAFDRVDVEALFSADVASDAPKSRLH